MGRRRRGRDIDGWLVIDKPVGPTSAHCVAAAQRALDARKAGHAGTLDPLASGVLAVAFGEATKTVPAAQDGAKTYRFTVRLGQATATDDAEGPVVAESAQRPADAAIAAALRRFEGETAQVPPLYSAVKHDGARAYDLARRAAAGEDVTLPDLAARPLVVHAIALVARPDADHAEIEMTCGKGGYVRAVARDLGRMLGCHGHVTALRRTAAGPFALSGAVPGAGLLEAGPGGTEPGGADRAALEAALMPVAAALAELPAVAVDAREAADLRQGRALARAPLAEGAEGWAADPSGAPVALVTVRRGAVHPTRVIAPRRDGAEGARHA